MANFKAAFTNTMLNEGGYQLTNIPGDRGGMTYAGISRKMWPNWGGWVYIDAGATPPNDTVEAFYKQMFWDPLMLDHVAASAVSNNIYDFAVNAGVKTAAKLAQVAAKTTPDGVMGQKTLTAINIMSTELFILRFSLAKIARYRDIVAKDRSQIKFLMGWLNRTLDEAKI